MIPVKAKPIVNNGIVVYCPKLTLYNRYLLKIEIYYSLNKPGMTWLKCENNSTLLWSNKTEVESVSTLFIYRTDNLLKAGFYTIKTTAYAQGRELKGVKTIGTLLPTKSLNIGLLYSIYPPIEMS